MNISLEIMIITNITKKPSSTFPQIRYLYLAGSDGGAWDS